MMHSMRYDTAKERAISPFGRQRDRSGRSGYSFGDIPLTYLPLYRYVLYLLYQQALGLKLIRCSPDAYGMIHHHDMSTTRRSSAPSDDGPSAKRQKVYRACLGCVNSKTRCEDVVPTQGCLRCRTKQKECSLMESGLGMRASVDRDTVDAELEARIQATEEGWRRLHQRVERLEQGLYSVGAAASSVASGIQLPIESPSVLSTQRPFGVNPVYKSLLWNRESMSETIFNLSSDGGYPDPVARGIVTMEQMESSFHLYVRQ